jgi:uncharacterized membrane protein
MKILKENQWSLLVLFAMVAASLYFYPTLPALVPTQFDFSGKPAHYADKLFVAVLNPTIYFVLVVLLQVLIRASPEKFAMEQSRKSLHRIAFGVGLLLLGLHLGSMVDPTGGPVLLKFIADGVSLFLIVVGNVFGKVERNFFIGIRTPWSLTSEENWRATHRFAGKLMVMFGMVLFVVSFSYATMPMILVSLLVPIVLPIFYSYIYYRRQLAN